MVLHGTGGEELFGMPAGQVFSRGAGICLGEYSHQAGIPSGAEFTWVAFLQTLLLVQKGEKAARKINVSNGFVSDCSV